MKRLAIVVAIALAVALGCALASVCEAHCHTSSGFESPCPPVSQFFKSTQDAKPLAAAHLWIDDSRQRGSEVESAVAVPGAEWHRESVREFYPLYRRPPPASL